MESSTPNANEPTEAIKSDEARIGVAVLWFPTAPNWRLHHVFYKAIQAGLLRKPVQVVRFGGSFTSPVAPVCLMAVSQSEKGLALEALKQTLTELDLMEQATIAHVVADVWQTFHGLGKGGRTFIEAFVLGDLDGRAEGELKRIREEEQQKIRDFIAHLERLAQSEAGAQGESPEAK